MSAVPYEWRQPFPDNEIPFILAAILRCMAAVKKLEQCEYETRITTRLLNQLLCDTELNARPTHLDPEVPEIDKKNKDGKIGRLDLRFLYSTGIIKPWPCFAIEAKRLHVTFPRGGWKSLISDYVTSETSKPVEDEQGMMCFVSGRYSRGLNAGAMLGYVFDGEVEAARTSIATAIQTHEKKLKLVPETQLAKSTILHDKSGVSESLHNLVDTSDLSAGSCRHFTIYHLLVEV